MKTTWILSQIAVPISGLDKRITDGAKMLSLTSNEVARECGSKPHPWDPGARYSTDVEVDALVAHAYGVTARKYGVILDTFDVLARKEIEAHGRYRFKNDCLAAYRSVA